jgi:hypothetical protein
MQKNVPQFYIMYHSMKTYWEVEIQLLKFTSTLYTGENLASRSGRFAPEAADVISIAGCGTRGPTSTMSRA